MEGGGNGAITCVFVCPWPKDVGCNCWLEHISKLVFPSLLPRPLLTKESWTSLSIKYNCNYLLDFFFMSTEHTQKPGEDIFFRKKNVFATHCGGQSNTECVPPLSPLNPHLFQSKPRPSKWETVGWDGLKDWVSIY